MWIWSAFGRLQIDLYHYIKRSFSLPAYKLDFVCQHFMSGKLGGVETGEETWFLKTKSTGDAVVGRYVVLLDETGDVVADKLRICEIEAGKGLRVEAPDVDDLDDLKAAVGDAVKWAIVKDDVSPADIFNLHLTGGAAGRAKVAAYCVQDCDLVIELYKKLDVFNNAMAMANACSVPVSYIFTRGQGIKIESLIFKECYERKQCVVVLPTQPRTQGPGGVAVNEEGEPVAQQQEDSYEGAIVLTPTPGFYFKSPIGVADFASLYPSTIISENISHDTLVWAKDYDLEGNFVGYAYGSEDAVPSAVAWTDIEFDIWGVKEGDTRKNPEKVKRGLRVCRYAQFAGDAKGTLPDIVQKLLAARKAKRKEAEKETDPFKKALLDAEQLAYKLTANSLYGQLGSGTFKIRLQHLAASVTAYGRKQIMFAKAAIEKFYGEGSGNNCSATAQTVYGDSVKGDTPIFIRRLGNAPEIIRIDELKTTLTDSSWSEWHTTKEAIELQNIEIWTDKGWTKVERVIRHRLAPNKKMFRVLTHTGVVDCTEDHSLVAEDGSEIKPSDVSLGTSLLHSTTLHKEFGNVKWEGTEKEAWAMGFFLADGSADTYITASGLKSTWAINKANVELLNKAAEALPFPTKILNTIESSGVYKLVPVGNIRDPATKYRDMFYNETREKRVPPSILNAPIEIVQSFMDGFYAGDGDKVGQALGNFRWDQKGKEVCAGLSILAQRLGYSISINDRASKPDVFRITCTKSYQRKPLTTIKKMYEITSSDVEYVYDLQTENHHFAVGPGNLVVHNTDSLFVCFNPKNPTTGELLQGREAIVETMRLTEEAGKLVTTCLKPPHDFEYDKVFSPFIIFSKKRYVGNKYEESPDEYYQNSMGIATKRRDYAGIVKVIYGGAIRILLTEKNPVAAADFVRGKLMELAQGKVSMTQLTLTKSLRAEYKSATPPAHKVLAERIAARDPGNAPASGDRISFLYVMAPPGQLAAKNQGDRIETPTWIREHGLEVDAKFYMEHQLMNPISQLFALIVEELPGCVAPGGRSWAAASASDREFAATEFLFRDALQACDRAAARRFGAKMFGLSISANRDSSGSLASMASNGTAVVARKATAAAAATTATPQVQPKISNFFVQKIIMKEIEKKITKKSPSPTKSDTDCEGSKSPVAGATPRRSTRIQGKTVDI
jgi:DNA polymerase elongation subunit (family B)